MKTLHPFKLGQNPLPAMHQDLTLTSAALLSMQPIADHCLCRLPIDMSVASARKRLHNAVGTMFLVTDHTGAWHGLIGQAELAPDRIMPMVSKTETPYTLKLEDVMWRKEQLQAISLAELEQATVLDVLRTLNDTKEPLLLVVDAQGKLCGIINGDELAARLSLPPLSRHSQSADIFHQLRLSHRLAV